MSEFIIECNYTYTDRNGKPCEEIVRCKDCKHFTPKGTHKFKNGKVNDDYCKYVRGWMLQMTPDGFCAWGERKSATELLPCPFCGHKAYTAETARYGKRYGVSCFCCGANVRFFDTEAEAIAAWNARTERTCSIESSYFDELWGQPCTELSCGHVAWQFAPKFCPECGARIFTKGDRKES